MLSATDALTETQGMYVGISAMQAGMKTQAFDVCMANVLEGDMQRLRMRLLSYLKPGGLFILSGMLTDQVPEVMQNFSPFLSDVETEEMSGWTRISGHISETVAPEEGRH